MAGSSVERVAPVAVLRMAAGPVEALLERYRGYLVSERCLAEETVRNYLGRVRSFLEGRVLAGQVDLEDLTPGEISAFIQVEVFAPSASVGASDRHGTAVSPSISESRRGAG